MAGRLGILALAVLSVLVGAALLLDEPTERPPEAAGGPTSPVPIQASKLPDPGPAPGPATVPALPEAPAERLRTRAPSLPIPVAGLPADQVLRGTVRDAAGAPLAGAWVAWRRARFAATGDSWPLYGIPCDHDQPVAPAPPDLRVVQTDAEGRFALRRQPGRLRVQHPDHSVALLEVDPGTRELGVTLEQGTVLEGLVLGPPPGAVVEVRGTANAYLGRTRAVPVHRQTLRDGGAFRLTGLAWGRTTLTVLDRSGQPLHARQLKLTRDSESRLEIDLGSGRPLRLELVGPGADDVQSLELQGPERRHHTVLTHYEQTLWLGAVDWTGPTRVKGLVAGLFSREASLGMLDLHRDRSAYSLELPGTLLRVHLGFEPRPRTVRVTLQSQQGPSGQQVTRYGKGSAGFVDFENVPPGRYLVKAHGLQLQRYVQVVQVPEGRQHVQAVLGPQLWTTRVLLLDGGGRPAVGHRVGLRLGGREIASTFTDETGRATFHHSPPHQAPLTVVPHRSLPATGQRGVTHVPLDPVLVPPQRGAGDELTLVLD